MHRVSQLVVKHSNARAGVEGCGEKGPGRMAGRSLGRHLSGAEEAGHAHVRGDSIAGT